MLTLLSSGRMRFLEKKTGKICLISQKETSSLRDSSFTQVIGLSIFHDFYLREPIVRQICLE